MSRYAQDGRGGSGGDARQGTGDGGGGEAAANGELHRRDAMDDELRQLTTATPGSDERRELLARAALLPVEQREALASEAAEWDALRAAAGAAPALPADLAARLRAVPDAVGAGVGGANGGASGILGGWAGVLRRPVGWRELAAVVVVAAGVSVALWALDGRGGEGRFLTFEQLEKATQEISEVHRSLPATRPEARAGELEGLIASRTWPFRATVPAPKAGADVGWTRLDCGATEVGGKAALFTRWRTPGGETATLVQFDADALDLPESFEVGAFGCAREREKKVEVWGDEEFECAWALVASDAVVGNPFVRGK